jgi:inosine/xanthosine triphosphatase
MNISIGTRSLPKIGATCRAFSLYPELWVKKGDNAIKFFILPEQMREPEKTEKVDKTSKVSLNPLSLEETIEGAKNRAKEAYDFCTNAEGSCDFGVGLEAGLFPVTSLESGYFDTTMCCIYNGQDYFFGGSPLFEYPNKVIERILAGEEAGLIIDFFGETAKGRPGVIGPLTDGRVMRDEFEMSAVIMALGKVVANGLYLKGK